MIFLRALRVSFVLFVTQKVFESKVNSIDPSPSRILNVGKLCGVSTGNLSL